MAAQKWQLMEWVKEIGAAGQKHADFIGLSRSTSHPSPSHSLDHNHGLLLSLANRKR